MTNYSTTQQYSDVGAVQVVYTGSGFDVSQTATGTDSDDHELDAISAANLANATYLKISILADVYVWNTATDEKNAKVTLQLQTKQTGGAYGDTLASFTWRGTTSKETNASAEQQEERKFITYYHTLTAGEKANGVQVKILATAVQGEGTHQSSLTNVQTVLETA